MVLELEGLATLAALELPEVGAVVVVGHVSMQLGDVGELLGADGAGL